MPADANPPPTRIVVCADDYALTPGVSRGIRELMARGRISATSVMTVSAHWPREAGPLKAVAGTADIGLHVTLTDQRPLGAMPAFAPAGRLPPLGSVLASGLTRRLPLAEIEAEIRRQLAAFTEHYGAAPAHIDGHHHMHQLPGVAEVIIRLAREAGGGRTWVRSCREPARSILRRGVGAPKALLLSALGGGIARQASRADVPVNQGFSGAYDFAVERRPLDELFARFLDGLGHNGVMMCHPGYADPELAGLDPMTTAREAELAFLAGEAWPRLLAARGLQVGPLAR